MVQPWKTCPYITERLLIGRKESNQTNKLPHDIQCTVHGCLLACELIGWSDLNGPQV